MALTRPAAANRRPDGCHERTDPTDPGAPADVATTLRERAEPGPSGLRSAERIGDSDAPEGERLG